MSSRGINASSSISPSDSERGAARHAERRFHRRQFAADDVEDALT
jgi:hypothetical protein